MYKFILTTLAFLAMTQQVFSQTSSNTKESFDYFTLSEGFSNSIGKGNTIGGAGDADLYQQIAHEIGAEYEAIGIREAKKVIAGNSLSITGGLNSIGFSYQKPFINFGMTVDRNLAPDVFDDKRWIVTDTCTIDIDASRVLGNLRDAGAIDMTNENLAAFAGIVFKRKFIWVHYANSYNEGLMRDFHKLFMPFSALSPEQISKIAANEMIFKEDSISLKAGGLVSAPLYTGITGMAGVLAKFEKLTRLEVTSLGNNQLQITSEKSKIATAGISMAIQADFLKILRLTLLSYDFSYTMDSSYKIYLNMKQNILVDMDAMNPVGMELKQILKGREGDLDILAPYLISEEKRVSQTINHKYNFLLLGAQKSSKTQQIEIAKEGRVNTFFKHNYEKMKYTEDAVSRLFAGVIYSLLNVDISASHMASDTKKVSLEYESNRNLLETRESINVGKSNTNDQKLSMSFISDFKTQKSSGAFGKKYRDRAMFILERFSGVDPLAINMIENESLRAPFHVQGKYQVNIEGIRYLNSLSLDTVFSHIDGLCNEYPKSGIINFRNLFDTCRKSLQNDYIEYYKDLTHDKVSSDEIDKCEKKAMKYFLFPAKKRAYIKNCLSEINKLEVTEWVNVPLWPLKNLSNNIVNNSYSKVHFFNLFGVQNVFFFGTFDAKTEVGAGFTTNFHEGAFKGLGAVDHYMRVENIRAPSSVVIDQ